MEEERSKQHLNQNSDDKWQDEVMRRRKVGPKRERKVSMEVFMDRPVREAIKALAATQEMGAQEYVEGLVVKEVAKYPDLVEEGKKMFERKLKKPYRTRLTVAEERAQAAEIKAKLLEETLKAVTESNRGR